MPKLEVIYRLSLAHPLLLMDSPSRDAAVTFPETGNRVWVEAPRCGPRPELATGRRGFDMLFVHVERECLPQERSQIWHSTLQQWGIAHDAARVLGRVLDFIRDEEFIRRETIAAYPVVPSETLQANPIIETAEMSVLFDGETVSTMQLGGLAALQISPGVWDQVCERLEQGDTVPAYRSFLLDAFHFALSGDPLRAVIMACAAWETALRNYLSTFTAKSPAFARLEERAPIPKLLALAEIAKGSVLLETWNTTDRAVLAERVSRLASLRNKLLHKGKTALPKGEIEGMVLAVDAAIRWLFE